MAAHVIPEERQALDLYEILDAHTIALLPDLHHLVHIEIVHRTRLGAELEAHDAMPGLSAELRTIVLGVDVVKDGNVGHGVTGDGGGVEAAPRGPYDVELPPGHVDADALVGLGAVGDVDLELVVCVEHGSGFGADLAAGAQEGRRDHWSRGRCQQNSESS